jgi:hypothetical protein
LGNRTTILDPVIPTFIHEVTHHWSFDSLVGGTIALLELNAKRHAAATECKTWRDQYHVFDCLLRATVASAILRPLSEGLALFAEYDAVPKESPQLSTTLLASIYCFGLPTHVGDDKLFPWKATLQLTRRTPNFCARKASVLKRPFSCQDAYLPGYLAVKNFWTGAVRVSPRFADTDLFLSFVRRFFYEDPRFASVILDPTVKETRAAANIVNYFFQRTNEFLSADTNSALDEWLASFKMPRGERSFSMMGAGIGARADDFELANKRLLPLWNARCDNDVLNAFVVNNTAILRKCMHIGSVTALAKRSDAKVAVYVNDENVLECDANGPSPPLGPGELRIAWDPDNTFLGAFFVPEPTSDSAKTTLVKTYFPGSEGSTSGKRAHQLANFVKVNDVINDWLEGQLHEGLSRHGGILQDELGRLRGETLQNAETIYGQLAVLNADTGTSETVLHGLQAAGLGSLLAFDGDLIAALAAVGIANTMTSTRSNVEFLLDIMGVTSAVRDKLFTKYQRPQGLPLLTVTDSHAIAFF